MTVFLGNDYTGTLPLSLKVADSAAKVTDSVYTAATHSVTANVDCTKCSVGSKLLDVDFPYADGSQSASIVLSVVDTSSKDDGGSDAWYWVLAIVLIAGAGAAAFFGYRFYKRRQTRNAMLTQSLNDSSPYRML